MTTRFKRSKLRIAAVILLSAMLASVQAVIAFGAQGTNNSGAVVSDNNTDVAASITKVLETGETTDTPDATFTFRFEQQLGGTVTQIGSQTPFDEAVNIMDVAAPIPDVSVSVSGKTGTTANGKKIIEAETANFLNGVTYTRAGVYKYKVTEQSGTYTIADASREKMTYSDAEYEIYVYVANAPDGGCYIKGIGTVLTKTDSLNTNPDAPEVGDKVDPTPNPDPGTTGEISTENSEMKFFNTYLKTPGGGGDPTDPGNQTLQIGKTVTGDLGDRDKYFDFSVMLKKPAVDTETIEYKGYVVDSTNAVVTSTDNVADAAMFDSAGKYIKFTLSNGTVTNGIKLKHGQRLVFTDVSVGTHFQAVETAAPNYTPSIDLTVGNQSVNSASAMDTGDKIVGNPANIAAYTNTYKDVTPTGIIMNNRSLFVTLALGILLIAGMLLARKLRTER